MWPGMKETLLFFFGHSNHDLILIPLDNLIYGMLVKAGNELAIFIVFKVIQGEMMSVLIKFLYQIKDGPVGFFISPFTFIKDGQTMNRASYLNSYGGRLLTISADVFEALASIRHNVISRQVWVQLRTQVQ